MAKITKSEQALVPGVEKLISKQLLDILDQDEVADRAHYAAQLMAKAAATDDPTIRKSWSVQAGAVLRMPKRREEIEKRVADLRTKARLSENWNKVSAAGLRDQADRVLADNPIAPRRQQALRAQLRKAADAGQMAIYDADGNLVGVVDPAKVTRLINPKTQAAAEKDAEPGPAGQSELGTPKTPASAETPAAAGMPDEVAKRRRTIGVVTRRL